MIEANRIEKAKVRAANRTLEMNTAQRLIFVVWNYGSARRACKFR